MSLYIFVLSRLWGLKRNGNWLQSLDLSANVGGKVFFLDKNPFSAYVDLTHDFSLRNLRNDGDTPDTGLFIKEDEGVNAIKLGMRFLLWSVPHILAPSSSMGLEKQ